MTPVKSFFLIVLLLLFCFCVKAQKDEFKPQWKKVEEFDKKGLSRSALQEVMKIFDAAIKDGNQAQQVKAAMYQMKYRNMVEEDNRENNIFYLDTLIAKSKTPTKNILQSMQAELFLSYRQNNRYKLYDHTKLVDEKSNDITTWSIEKLNATITLLYKASLKNEAVLKSTSLNGLDAIIVKGVNTRNLRPTLYDFLAHRAVAYFMSSENDVTSPSYKFILNDEKIFAPVNTFIPAKFITRDTGSLYFHAIQLLQDILSFHSGDLNKDALIDADLIRLAFVYDHGVFTNKDKLYEEALKKLESDYSSSPASAQAMYLRAQMYFNKGKQYDPFTRKDLQFEIKKAKELLENAVAKFPKSEGGINAKNLLNQVRQPLLELETEKVNIPLQPFRSLVKYKNVRTVYLRLIKTNKDEIKKIEKEGYEKLWPAMTALKPLKSWSISLPDPQDFQKHSTELKIDPLPIGTYFLMASIDQNFSLGENIITRQIVYVSNIGYIYNNRDELIVLDRGNGQPLSNATVQLWDRRYNYTNRNYEVVKTDKYITDKNGLAKIRKTKEQSNNIIQVLYNSDELFTDDNYYSYAYNSYERPSTKRTFFFTDRSIYRPGQKVFFKGIVVITESSGKKSNVINNYRTNVILYDVNQQKVGSIQMQTNEYGSYNGSFSLPEGVLNGQFHITDSVNNSTVYINVEEYKRPKFYVEVLKPEGTYRVNDSILVKGNAKAYAGNNIDGAKVTYRVVRKVRYPMWWWGGYRKIWPPYGNSEAMEVTNGETSTNNNGEFFITFKAIPDETVDKKGQPVFYYEVSTDITDINGETRSGSTTVAVAYQALQLNIIAPDKMPADSLKTIKVSSTNMNGLFEKTRVNLQVYKLQVPGKIFRPRYWNMPDQYVMNKQEYYASFPYDAYMDEDQVNKWPLGQKIIDITDTTSANSSFNIPATKPESGWYKVITLTKDKYGEEVRAEKYIQLTSSSSTIITDPIVINIDNKNAEPGQKISYSISTGFNSIWLIHTLSKSDKTINTTYKIITSSVSYKDQIAVTEDDRGGLTLNYVFIQHNRVYSGNEFFSVPWNNKDLNITYETFRDKTLPGSEEKWKIKISGNKGEKVAAETLISMYDASLDQFKPHSWTSLKSLWPIFAPVITWTQNSFSFIGSEQLNHINIPYSNYPKSYDELANNGWNEGYTRFYRDGRMQKGDVQAMAIPIQNDKVTGIKEVSASKFTPPKVVGDEQVNQDTSVTEVPDINEQQQPPNVPLQLRKNFNETAFFFPALMTDANGNIEFSFTIPEALTEWKMMSLTHNKELASGYSEKTVITQKPLMVQPNPPRFLREGDQIEFSGKIVNLTDKEITGTAQLELFDAATNKSVDGWFKNVFPNQYFTVAARQSFAIKFPVGIPFSFNSAVVYRIKAVSKDGSFSDGEEAALPVLTNRVLVTETLPLNMRNTTTKNFRFDKLLTSANSGSLTNHALTVEYTSNPAWYAVQALPYLMEYPYECSEQNFNRYYANSLASFISNSIPKIKAVFEKWKTTDTAALMSNLQKNEELKSVLLQETPWVLNAQNESQQKRNIALLFDMVRMAREKDINLGKLKEMQSSNGGFMWFRGGPDDRYITQYILTGIGHLRKLNALSTEDLNKLKPIVDKALPYLDARIKEDYDYLVKYKVNMKENHLSYIAIQYLYMRSFFPDNKIDNQTAYTYYRNQAKQYWLSQGKYMQAMIALALHRTGDEKIPKDIIRSLKENAIYKEEMGMYWKEFATGGYYWHQAPVESQAMMIEAFTDVDKNQVIIDDLKTWLLKNKQTNQWSSTKATAEACYALLLQGSNWLAEEKTVTISLGNMKISSADVNTGVEVGTGYFKQTIEGGKVQQGMGNITVSITPVKQVSTSTSWGAVYWQYFEDLDKISSATTPLKLAKKLFIEKNSDKGPVLKALNDGDELKIGDKIKVRIELRSDRDMEYVHMKDMRASCMEPVNVLSGYKYQGGLGYYETTKDASTNFFFGWLPRGTYVFEYPMFVTHAGNFSNGVTTIQCMYAPEFTSHSEGIKVNVVENK